MLGKYMSFEGIRDLKVLYWFCWDCWKL